MNKRELELNKEAFNQALNIIGSQKKLAAICGFTQQAVSKYSTGQLRHLRPDYAVKIQRALQDRIKCSDLMPNYDWSIFFGESIQSNLAKMN